MEIQKLFIKDTNGKKSLTATVFLWGAVVVNLKLILAGIEYKGMSLSAFDGADYAAAMAALGSIYVLRRSTDPVLKSECDIMREEILPSKGK